MAESREEWTAPSVVVATCLWLGRIPLAPGTWGAIAGVGLSMATGALAGWLAGRLSTSGMAPWGDEWLIEAGLIVSLNVVGVPICTAASRRLGRGSDPGAIVLDEATSLPLGMLVVPFADRTWPVLAVGWLLHRLFDVWKPFPCRRLEKLPAGLGIMADDWGAAAWMAAVLVVWRNVPL